MRGSVAITSSLPQPCSCEYKQSVSAVAGPSDRRRDSEQRHAAEHAAVVADEFVVVRIGARVARVESEAPDLVQATAPTNSSRMRAVPHSVTQQPVRHTDAQTDGRGRGSTVERKGWRVRLRERFADTLGKLVRCSGPRPNRPGEPQTQSTPWSEPQAIDSALQRQPEHRWSGVDSPGHRIQRAVLDR